MKDRTNIYWPNGKLGMFEQTKEKIEKAGKCFLCGGDHSKDRPTSVLLDCPHCFREAPFYITPHCPGGVSHGESKNCPNCKSPVFLVVYYDGDVIIQKR